MKHQTLTLTLALLAACLAAPVAAKKAHDPEYLAAQRDARAAKAEAAAAPAEVGDAFSFGRNVKFIGLVQSGLLNLASDCTPDPAFPPGPDDRCITTAPAPGVTPINISDVGRVLIPGKSAKSLICHWQTPFATISFRNTTGVYQPQANFILTPVYTIQNEVLNDPALIDPATGAPFGGSFQVGLSGIREVTSLQPGDFRIERENATRVCLGGMISKQMLLGFGLSDAQADKFFTKDTVITVGMQGSARLVDFASVIYGVRFVGD